MATTSFNEGAYYVFHILVNGGVYRNEAGDLRLVSHKKKPTSALDYTLWLLFIGDRPPCHMRDFIEAYLELFQAGGTPVLYDNNGCRQPDFADIQQQKGY